MSETEDEEDAVEAGVTAASEEISAQPGRGRRWAAWGSKEMLIASTAAVVAIQHWKSREKRRLNEEVS